MLSSGMRAVLQKLMQRSIFQRWHGYNGLVLVRERANQSNSLTHGVALERRRCIIFYPRRRVWAPCASVLPVSATPFDRLYPVVLVPDPQPSRGQTQMYFGCTGPTTITQRRNADAWQL